MKMNFLVSLILLASAHRAQAAPSLGTIWQNNAGVVLFKAQKADQALEKWSQALANEPDSAEIQLNIGLAFEAAGQSEKAMQSFHTGDLMAQSAETQFLARFNQGALYQKAQKINEALQAYHAALDVNPTSKETKINIELLIQQQQQQKQQKKGQGNDQQKQQGGQGQDQKKDKDDKKGDQKDPKDQKDQQGQDKDQQKKENQPKQYAKEPKPQPKPFKSDELNQSDVNKILGELRNQEQRIRAEYNKREVKEKPRGKDW